MKCFMLKFNHGVEIGAKLAYLGHYHRTKDQNIKDIAYEELRHEIALEGMLKHYGQEPNPIIDAIFWTIGNTIYWLCKYCPIWSLNLIARCMEKFAIFNYKKMTKLYPAYANELEWMAITEMKHERYFKRGLR